MTIDQMVEECIGNESRDANINSSGERICWFESRDQKVYQYKKGLKCEYPIHRYSKMSKRTEKYMLNFGGC